MRYSWLIILLVAFLHSSCKSQKKKINGVSFVAAATKISEENIEPVKRVSANYVSLMPFGFIENIASPNIVFNSERQWFGERLEGVEQYAAEFEKSKIKVMLKPQIWVWRGEYTGLITMDSEEKWKQLEESYSAFIMAYATLAEKLDVDIFCIGTELEKFVMNRPEYWKNLIVEIRKVYNGKLTYAANWDEYKRITFWNDLDYIGVDAYFPLADDKSPSKEALAKSWSSHKKELETMAQRFARQVLFTEYGYRSVYYTGKEPWSADKVEGSVDLESQKNALEVLYNQFWNEYWFAGGFLWKWFHDHDKVGGENNNRFTPQNKPAEEVVKKYYETSR